MPISGENKYQNPATDLAGGLPPDIKNIFQEDSAVNAAAQPMDDIVFEKRNKAYGAYVLRQQYIPNVYKGLLITVIAVLFVIFLPAITKYFEGAEAVDKTAPRKLVYSELTAPPPIDKPKPPPPQIQIPKLQKVIKFVPPKVVKEEVIEETPTIKEIKENETSSENIEGTAQVTFDEPVADVVEDNSNEVYAVVEQQPEFEGGYEAMIAFIKKNMVYPAMARRMQTEGTVSVSFIVSKTGTISDVTVLRGISPECDKEAIRVIQLMPPWTPGKQNGKAVFVRFIMPIKFRLH